MALSGDKHKLNYRQNRQKEAMDTAFMDSTE
jgi:hypothetical protein